MFESLVGDQAVAAVLRPGGTLPADPESLLDVVEECERAVARLYAVQARAMAALEQARRGTPLAEFVPDEISAVLRLGPHTARDRLMVAGCLTRRLPATLAALETGEIDYYRARCVAEATVRLEDDALAAAVETHVLPVAREQTAAQLRAALRRAVLAADPAGGEARHQRACEQRRVTRQPEEDGMASLWVYGPADGVTAVYTALDGLARTMRGDPEETRTLDQLRADALFGLGLAVCDAGGLAGLPLGTRRRARAHLHVTVGADTLLGVSEAPGWLAGHGPIPASVARRVAGDATWRRILTDPASGSAVDYAAQGHDPGPVLAGHVTTRDATCRFPTCNVPAESCDLDHTVPFPDGQTTAGNLGPLCRRHHRAKQAGYHLHQPSAGIFTWTTPTGRRHTVHPPALAPPSRTTTDDHVREAQPP